MLRFNHERIINMVSSMRVAVNQLSELGQLSEKYFLSDSHKIASAKYNFIVAIEAAIDMGNHIISQNGFRAPEDYADTFNVLGENGVVRKEFVEELRKMARFRNRLVHIYWEVDDKQVYEIARKNLMDFKTFLNSIFSHLSLDDINITKTR
ncbi:MAG: DUF86 domain-containing protein [Thermodesulfobacteriota bacterium]|nr:DUF86 domain-containing protein [Thermodesulfobacteriota bacterium]